MRFRAVLFDLFDTLVPAFPDAEFRPSTIAMVQCLGDDPDVFQSAYEPLDVAPEHCMYVGDGFSQELAGARMKGMHPVLISMPGESD